MGSNFDISPPRDTKVEFPPTPEGVARRIVFYGGAAIAVLCALAILSSLAVAAVAVGKQLLHLH